MCLSISDQLDFSADGNFRLKYRSSASFLMSYQPIWAELGEKPVAEVVISLKGGGKANVKRVEQKKKDAKRFKDELVQKNASLNLPSVASIPQVKVLEAKIAHFLNLLETKCAKDAFEWLFKQSDLNQLSSAVAELKGDDNATHSSNNPEVKIKKASQHLFGKELGDIIVARDTLSGIISSCELAFIRAHSEAGVADHSISKWQSQWKR